MRLDSHTLKGNISWAAGHLFNGKYYEKYKAKKLTLIELNDLCQSFRKHRHYMADTRKWYQFRLKKRDRKIIYELNDLIRDIYRVTMYGHPYDLSPYGGPNNTKSKP